MTEEDHKIFIRMKEKTGVRILKQSSNFGITEAEVLKESMKLQDGATNSDTGIIASFNLNNDETIDICGELTISFQQLISFNSEMRIVLFSLL